MPVGGERPRDPGPGAQMWPRDYLALVEELTAQRDRLRAALRVIVGPATDGDPFIEEYRAAGGGYEGLQAVAEAALNE